MRWQSFMVLALLGVSPRVARARPPTFAWRGPECADAQAGFERHLDALVSAPERARLGGAVTISRSSSGFEVRVDIELDGRGLGSRTVVSPDCATAAETAAVASAMAAFPADSSPPPSSDGSPAGAARERSSPAPDSRPERPVGNLRRARPEVRVGALATLQFGLLPEHVWGGALELGVGLTRRWSIALLGNVSLEQEHTINADQRVLLRVLSGVARVCYAPFSEDLVRIDACGGAEFLWWRGEGSGFLVNHSDSLTSAAPLLAFDASLRSPAPLEWRTELEALVPLARRSFTVDGEEVARPAPVAIALRIGPFVRF